MHAQCEHAQTSFVSDQQDDGFLVRPEDGNNAFEHGASSPSPYDDYRDSGRGDDIAGSYEAEDEYIYVPYEYDSSQPQTHEDTGTDIGKLCFSYALPVFNCVL